MMVWYLRMIIIFPTIILSAEKREFSWILTNLLNSHALGNDGAVMGN